MTETRWTTLPCGREPEQLLALAADEAPVAAFDHEATCPYCQQALQEFAELWRPVREWAHQDVETPLGLMATVISRVRKIAQSPRHVAAITARGTTTVTSWVLGLIAAAVTEATPGVSRITPAPPSSLRSVGRPRFSVRYGADGVDITEVDEAAISLAIAMTAEAGSDLSDVADRVRHNVISAIGGATSIEVVSVDVTIGDISSPAGEAVDQ
jgi:uncharacterized alkaline shock family protein YloU